MKVYEVKTVLELTDKQHKRLKKLVRQARKKNIQWSEEETLQFLTTIRSPEFWDIQLNFYENMIQKI